MKPAPLLFFCFLFSVTVSAQGPIVKNYTTTDGLASNTVYYSMQDSNGFIWFATDNGVSRFDGSRFKNYTVADGLSDNTVLKIVEDAEGRMWFLTFNGKLSFYKDNKFYNTSNCDYLKKINFKGFINCFYQDRQKNIWISSADFSLVELLADNEVIKFKQKIICRYIWQDKQQRIRILGTSELVLVTDTGFAITPLPFIGFGRTLPGDTTLLVQTINNISTLTLSGKLTKIEGAEKYTDINGIFMSPRKKYEIWAIGSMGAIDFDNGIISPAHEHHYLQNYSLTSVMSDKDGNLWFTSVRSGVVMMPSLETHVYDVNSGLADNNVTALADIGDSTLLAGTFNGSLQLIQHGQVKQFHQPFVYNQKEIMNIDEDKNGTLWILTAGPIFKYRAGKFTVILRHLLWNKTLFISTQNVPWIGWGRGLKRIENDSLKLVYASPVINRVYAITELNNELLLGTDNGFFRYKDSTMIADTSISPLLANRINALAVTADSTIWMATNGEGLLSLKHNKVTHYSTASYLSSNKCNYLFADSNKLYVATEKGLNLIKITGNTVQVSYFSLGNGAISDHINQVVKQGKNKIALATDHGIVEIDTRTIRPSYTSAPYINSVLVNDRKRSLNGKYRFKYYENSVNIDFGAINFNASGNINYRYKLTGFDTGWTYTTYSNIKFANLHPGNYKFIVAAQNTDGRWNPVTASIAFYIETPWWQTWWFRLLVAITVIGIIALLILWRISIYEEKINRRRAAAESELKALRAQINPHFLYNSLSTIQALVVQNQKEDANIYFSKFASLLRGILNNSRQQQITLKDEIDAMQLYLELEMLRYNWGFDFKIELDSAINPDEVYIPSMVLQPYVENAVLHGLAPLKTGGKLVIRFTPAGDFICCVIEDNGIGRKKAAEAKQKSTWKVRPSLGMVITQERMDLINSNQKQKINLEITDLADEFGTPIGTRVTIYFPK